MTVLATSIEESGRRRRAEGGDSAIHVNRSRTVESYLSMGMTSRREVAR
jgi:hypothetical protein